MYISVSDYEWFQNEDEVHISVPLKGTSSKNCDIFISSRYIKITFKPYIFECALWGEIDVDFSNVVLESSVIANFKLRKKDAGDWEHLESELMKDKMSMMKIRQDALAEIQVREKEREKKNREERRLGEKDALKAMMKIEGDERSRHEAIKKEATFTAMQELVKLREEKKKLVNLFILSEMSFSLIWTSEKLVEARAFARQLCESNQAPKPLSLNLKQNIFKSTEKPLVPVRNSNKIEVSFTPRVFPTPERESTKPDEEEWLRKQAERKRVLASKVAEGDDLSEAERDPVWLQKKAASLFKAGDYEAAAFAYTEALKRAPKLPSIHLNRSACYLQTRNFFRALEDASAALDLLNPPVPQNLDSRVKAHVRRGVAFCNLQMFKEGVSEYEAALKLKPDDETISRDLQNLKEMMPYKTVKQSVQNS